MAVIRRPNFIARTSIFSCFEDDDLFGIESSPTYTVNSFLLLFCGDAPPPFWIAKDLWTIRSSAPTSRSTSNTCFTCSACRAVGNEITISQMYGRRCSCSSCWLSILTPAAPLLRCGGGGGWLLPSTRKIRLLQWLEELNQPQQRQQTVSEVAASRRAGIARCLSEDDTRHPQQEDAPHVDADGRLHVHHHGARSCWVRDVLPRFS